MLTLCVCVCVCVVVECVGRPVCVLTSGGDDGALAVHHVDLSIKRVTARGSESRAHAAQITGTGSTVVVVVVVHATPTRYSSRYLKLPTDDYDKPRLRLICFGFLLYL